MSVITVQKHLLHEYKLPESSQNINLSNEIQVAVFDNFDLTLRYFYGLIASLYLPLAPSFI